MIYAYTIIQNNYQYPLTKLYELINSSKDLTPFYGYDYYTEKPDPNLIFSKQYMVHKLYWYIILCFKSKKINNENLQIVKYRQIVITIVSWLFTDDIFKKLLEVEPKGLFYIIKTIFQEERIHYAIADAKVKILNDNYYGSRIEFSLPSFLQFVEDKCREVKKEATYEQFYEFLANISNCFKLKNELIIEATSFLLNHNRSTFTDSKNEEVNYDYIDKMNTLLIKMLDSTNNSLSEHDLSDLLLTSEFSPLILVKIKILSLLKNYKKCLDVFLEKGFNKDREKLVFDWIDNMLKDLQNSDFKSFKELKDEVLEKIPQLSEISVECVGNLVDKWFKDDHESIIYKLDKAEKLQIKYVENYIEKNRIDIEDYITNNNRVTINQKVFKKYLTILELHVILMCKLKPEKVKLLLKVRY